jgi:hypothetical protein
VYCGTYWPPRLRDYWFKIRIGFLRDSFYSQRKSRKKVK